MKKICVLTGTRAEYSLLYHTLNAINKSDKLELQLIVSGSHLSAQHGFTVNAIKSDNIKIDYEIDMLLDSEKKSSIPKSMGLLMVQLAQCFDSLKPDMLLILGDRYEIMAAASCAVAMNIPIAHISGGESTEGAIDEQIRHAITKMAHLHFVSTEIYKHNVLKMGEQTFRVFNVGAPVVENINKLKLMPKEEIEKILKIYIKEPLFLITYHPVTLMRLEPREQVLNLLAALSEFKGTFIFTGANADFGGNEINHILKKYTDKNEGCYFFQSLGAIYIHVCQWVNVMVGNSSSGIIEAPCLKLPVVNIGDRQKGRLRHANIIDVGYDKESIQKGIDKALYGNEFIAKIENMSNLYGNGTTSSQITEILENCELTEEFLLKSLYSK